MKPTMPRRFFLATLLAVTGALSLNLRAAPPAGILDDTHASVRAVLALQSKVTPALMRVPGVLGTAVGVAEDGSVALTIYVDEDLPGAANIKGPAGSVVIPTDHFRAFGKPGSGGGSAVSHTAKQTLPIQLGTSGGWGFDLANGYCCGGTLGSLITCNGVQYILSNYHVFEADIVSGGNTRIAQLGDAIIQPGLIDVNCTPANAQSVASLVPVSSLPSSNVDVGVAQVTVPGVVSSSILEVGPISAQTAAASLNKAVKKSGRTSGLTRSKITGLNATISVAYENECAGGTAFTKTFTGQIVIGNSGSAFLKGGDSGSLMVEDLASNPKAVGLLYAGSKTTAIANPIGEVLSFIGSKLGGTATMVGN